ncbi:MAG: glycine cleavage system aminomethyltransferase GcvT [Microbacteriaceae bacterium]|nr:glycine cleavage system aminomethyltransferase GcvT [Microbacteriaceae bacterium]
MTELRSTEPRTTALHAEHTTLGAHFTDFGGWEMPLRYGSELAEHRAVREAAGLFDLSHMGEIRVTGPEAASFLNTALVGNLAVVATGKAKYSLIVTAEGGIIDDLIVYRLAEHEFLVVPNAGNAAEVYVQLVERARGFDVRVDDETASTSLIAVQGPASASLIRELNSGDHLVDLEAMPYYSAAMATIAGINVLLARTGYTGEDGFELLVPNEQAVPLWRALLQAGEPHGLTPAGLAARDSLRLEAGMPLYGNELSPDTNPFDAGLGGVVSFKKSENFIGRAALEAMKAEGPRRTLVGLRGLGRRAGRSGYPVLAEGREVGVVTSGQPSPTLGFPIVLAFVEPGFAAPGTSLDVDLRGKPEPCEVVTLPFYSRKN